jgi:hypothetical protein
MASNRYDPDNADDQFETMLRQHGLDNFAESFPESSVSELILPVSQEHADNNISPAGSIV